MERFPHHAHTVTLSGKSCRVRARGLGAPAAASETRAGSLIGLDFGPLSEHRQGVVGAAALAPAAHPGFRYADESRRARNSVTEAIARLLRGPRSSLVRSFSAERCPLPARQLRRSPPFQGPLGSAPRVVSPRRRSRPEASPSGF